MENLEPLVVFWSGWGIHFMVLLSFTFQVVLLVLADIRRYKDWTLLKVIIWLAYMMADTTAIYALGHMSVICRSSEHHLMALWAPLLLVHLGGQDNITAYAIEDNRLWLRHFQNFGLQILGAAYVLYVSSILSSPREVLLATILMFVVGVLKYGERVWALMCANSCASSSLSATSYKKFTTDEHPDRAVTTTTSSGASNQQTYGEDANYVQCLSLAYSLLDVPKQMFEGPTRYVQIMDPRRYSGLFVLGMVVTQLSMMYDLLYTKAAVVYNWYGLSSRIISLAFTITAVLLLVSLSDRDGYNRVDVIVTKCLLFGAVVLEIMSVFRAVFSKWTAVLLIQRKWRNRIGFVAQIAEKVFTWTMERREGEESWLDRRVQQHSFFQVQQHSNYSIGSKIAKWMGQEDWWDSMFYSWTTHVRKDIILKMVDIASEGHNQFDMTDSRGLNAMRRQGHSAELVSWIEALELELDESILVWHIASGVYTQWLKEIGFRKVSIFYDDIHVLSNYMFFLLAARPYMLPYPVSRQKYVKLCYDAGIHLRRWTTDMLVTAIGRQKENLLSDASFIAALHNASYITAAPGSINRTLDIGCQLAAKLMSKSSSREHYGALAMILEVWIEILCYTAYRCNENYHAKHLIDGGEFMTVVALLMIYMSSGLINRGASVPEDPNYESDNC